MWVGGVADLHHVVGKQHLVGDGLCHAGAECDESGRGVLVVRPESEHLEGPLHLQHSSQCASEQEGVGCGAVVLGGVG